MKFTYLTITLFAIGISIQGQSQGCLDGQFLLDGTATDQTTNANHGSVHGATPTTGGSGVSNTAMSFDGTNDYIVLGDDFDHQERTISLFFKADHAGQTIRTIYNSDNPGQSFGNTILGVIEMNGSPHLRYVTGGTSANLHNEPIQLGTWYHAVISISTTEVNYYLNCDLVATTSPNYNSSQNGSGGAKVGCGRLINHFFKGSIDNLSIYDCAMDIEELCGSPVDTTSTLDLPDPKGDYVDMVIYPNPTDGAFSIEIDNPSGKDYDIRILDNTGRQLNLVTRVNGDRLSVDMSTFSAGNYHVVLSYKGAPVSTQQIIIR